MHILESLQAKYNVLRFALVSRLLNLLLEDDFIHCCTDGVTDLRS